jgi:hypothetical protein
MRREGLAFRLAGTFLDFAAFGGLCLLLERFHAAPRLTEPMALIVFALVTAGATHILVHSAISYPLSQLAGLIPVIGPGLYSDGDGKPKGLLSCSLCTGMWIGALMAALGFQAWSGVGSVDYMAHGLVGAVAAGLASRVLPK